MKLNFLVLILTAPFLFSQIARADSTFSAPDQMFGIEYGRLANNNPDGSRGWFGAPGVRYGVRVYDEFSLEAGYAVFDAVNYAVPGDNYPVTSLLLVASYSIPICKNFRVIPYAGVRKNFVYTDTENSTSGGDLETTYAAVGATLSYSVGWHWNARLSAGNDAFLLGAAAQF